MITSSEKARVKLDPSGELENVKAEILRLEAEIRTSEVLQVEFRNHSDGLQHQMSKTADDPAQQDFYKKQFLEIRDSAIELKARIEILNLYLEDAQELRAFILGFVVVESF